MGASQRFDLKLRPSPLEWFFLVVIVPLLAFEVFVLIRAVAYPAAYLVEALSAPDHPRWLSALGWSVWVAATVALFVVMLRNQARSKMSHPGYLSRRLFRSRLVVGRKGVELGRDPSERWPWSEVAGFEVHEDVRFAPRAGRGGRCPRSCASTAARSSSYRRSAASTSDGAGTSGA